MARTPWIRTLPLALALLGGTAFAGEVVVTSRDPSTFTDPGNHRWDEAYNVRVLATELQVLGQRGLPQGQTLRVEFLDIDLAGEVRPNGLRVVRRNPLDGPRIRLRYTLEQDGRVLASGEEFLSPTTYPNGLTSTRYRRELDAERRLLDHWFEARFGQQQAAALPR